MPSAATPVENPEGIELRNLTPHPLRVELQDGAAPATFVIAPLATRTLVFATAQAEAEARHRLRALHDRQIVRLADVAEEADDTAYVGMAVWAVILGIVAGAAWLPGKFPHFSRDTWLGVQGDTWLTAGAPAVLLALLGIVYLMAKGKLAPWLRRALLGMRQTLTLILVVAIATALPAAALALFVRGDLSPAGLAAGAELLSAGGATGLGRGIVFAFVCVAAALPGLLYFLFDRKRVTQLRESFEQQIFRLDRQVETLADVQARYGSRLQEIWGDSAVSGTAARLFSASQWPVVLCTLVVAGGWSVIVLFAAIQHDLAGARDLPALLRPLDSSYAFGFLGAYYFALGMIARRYTRGDLQPKAYSMITARVLVVLVTAAVVSAVFGESPSTWLLMFVFGVFPETYFVFLRESVAAGLRTHLRVFDDRLPLTRLEGIDLYDRARLGEEGIANLDNLAHGDLVDLMLNTSIASAQLVEWVDQAMLYLRVHDDPNEPGKDNPDRTWHELRAMGVRRASDLVAAPDWTLRAEVAALARAQGRDEALVARLQALVNLLAGDEWFADVLHWRTSDKRTEQIWRIDAAGNVTTGAHPATTTATAQSSASVAASRCPA